MLLGAPCWNRVHGRHRHARRMQRLRRPKVAVRQRNLRRGAAQRVTRERRHAQRQQAATQRAVAVRRRHVQQRGAVRLERRVGRQASSKGSLNRIPVAVLRSKEGAINCGLDAHVPRLARARLLGSGGSGRRQTTDAPCVLQRSWSAASAAAALSSACLGAKASRCCARRFHVKRGWRPSPALRPCSTAASVHEICSDKQQSNSYTDAYWKYNGGAV